MILAIEACPSELVKVPFYSPNTLKLSCPPAGLVAFAALALQQSHGHLWRVLYRVLIVLL